MVVVVVVVPQVVIVWLTVCVDVLVEVGRDDRADCASR